MTRTLHALCRLAAVCAVCVLIAIPALAAAATGSLTGTVRDGTGAVIAGARVALMTGDQIGVRSTRTGADGQFTFDQVSAGRYVLIVSFPGFSDKRVAVTVAATGAGPVDVILEPTPVTSEVTVTATPGMVQDTQSIPQAVNVVESKEILERAKSIVAQAVLEEPGLNLVRTSPTMAGIYVRGLTGNKVNVFVDGVRYSNSAQRGGVNTFLDMIEPTSLQAIEVLRGPNSAQYGSDALGGSVQFLSVVPSLAGGEAPSWRGSFGVRTSSADKSVGADFGVGYSAATFGLLFSGAGRTVGEIRAGQGIDSHAGVTRFLGVRSDVLMDARLPDTNFNQYGGTLKMNWTPTTSDQFLFSFSHSRQDKGKRYDQLLGGDGNLLADLRDLLLDFFYVKYNRAGVGPFDQVTVTYSLNTQREERVNQGGNGNPNASIAHEPERMWAHGIQVKATGQAGQRQQFLFGGEVYPERIDAPSTSFNPVTGVTAVRRGRVPDGATYRSYGIYAQDAFDIIPGKLKAVGNLRYAGARYRSKAADSPLVSGKPLWPDDASNSSSVTFRAGIVSTPKEGFSLNANVSRGFRAPHITDLGTLGLTGAGYTVSGNTVTGLSGMVGTTAGATAVSSGQAVENVTPETSLNYEAGFGYHSRRIATEGSFFVNNIYGNIAYQALILPQGAVGTTLADQAIASQGATGVVFVPASSSPVLVRANYGDARIVGFEHTFDYQLSSRMSVGTVLTVLHAKDTATGLPPNLEGGTPGPDFYLKLRYSSPSGRYWFEPIVHAVGTQTRLSSLDLEDRRTAAPRTRTTIRNFFLNGATARGWVSKGPDGVAGTADDVLTATGETVAQIQDRVLGTATSGTLFTEVAGYVTVAIRGGFRFGTRHEVIWELENLTDKNYRGIAWGIDAPGRGVSIAYVTRF